MPTLSDLYKKSEYINPNLYFLFNSFIIEYDLKDAGFNIIREFELLSKKQIEKLEKMTKENRKIEIGKLQLKDPSLKDGLKEGFIEARRRFFEYFLIKDEDVVSIKKDAIFLRKELSPNNKVGKYLNFRMKNEYIAYLRFSKKVEVYYNPIRCDIKGINRDNLVYHNDYMIDFIKRFLDKISTESKETVLGFLKRFSDKYKCGDVSIGYYREFNERSQYNTSKGYVNDDIDAMMNEINIEYNMINVIIPLIKMVLN